MHRLLFPDLERDPCLPFKSKNKHIEVLRRKQHGDKLGSAFNHFASRKHVLHQVCQIWSSRAVFVFFPCSKSRDLQSEHGFRASSFKNIRKKLDLSYFLRPKYWKKTGKWNDIGRMLVPKALNRSKKMRKAGADNFPNSSAWKTQTKPEQIKTNSRIFLVVLRISDNQGSGKPGFPVFTKNLSEIPVSSPLPPYPPGIFG